MSYACISIEFGSKTLALAAEGFAHPRLAVELTGQQFMAEVAPQAEGKPSPYSVLIHNPAYRWFYAGQGASLVGTWSQAAAARWIVYEITKSERAVGIVDAIEVLPGVVVGLFAGAVADKVSGRLMLSAMQVGQAVLAFLLAILVGAGHIHIWQMALLLAFGQVFVTFEEPSRQVFQRRLVGRSAMGHAIALETGLFNVSRVLGPAVAGLCLSLLGQASPFAINGCSFLAALMILLWLRTPKDPEDNEPAEPEAEVGLAAGWQYVWNDRRVFRIFVLLSFFGVAGLGYTALVPAYAQKLLNSSTGGYSALQVGGGIGSTIGAFVVASVAASRRRDLLVVAGMVVAGLSLVLAGFAPGLLGPKIGLPVAVVMMFVNGAGTIAVFATAQTLIQAAVPDAIRGRVVGLWMIVFSGSAPIGSLFSGIFAQSLGVVPIMVSSGLICVVVGTLVFLSGILIPTPQEEEAGAV